MQSSITMSKDLKRRSPLKKGVQYLKYSVGTDISKEKFDACVSVIDTDYEVKVLATKSFRNTQVGIEEFYRWSQSKFNHESLAVYTMEATGVYYEKLAWFLNKKDCHVSVVLPNRSKKYMQSLGIKSKNDKIDSKGLARMGAEQKLAKWEAPDEKILQLRNLTRHQEGLQITKTRINNQIQSMLCSEHIGESIVGQQEEIIQLIDKKIKETEKLIINLMKSDPELLRKTQQITKVKGIGVLTLATIIAETNAFNLFKNQNQLASYAGYDIIENQSGKHVGKTKISKKGNSHIRRILYMPALTAVSYNEPIFKNLYERVYGRTKIKMKGYVAVQRKLLVLIYTLWKNDTEFDRDYQINKQSDEHPEMQSKSSSFCLAL
jgi:transposase